MKIAVAGTGYVGLSIATLLAQKNDVTAVDVIAEKVELINQRRSPIQDEYIEKYRTYAAERDAQEKTVFREAGLQEDETSAVPEEEVRYKGRMEQIPIFLGKHAPLVEAEVIYHDEEHLLALVEKREYLSLEDVGGHEGALKTP